MSMSNAVMLFVAKLPKGFLLVLFFPSLWLGKKSTSKKDEAATFF